MCTVIEWLWKYGLWICVLYYSYSESTDCAYVYSTTVIMKVWTVHMCTLLQWLWKYGLCICVQYYSNYASVDCAYVYSTTVVMKVWTVLMCTALEWLWKYGLCIWVQYYSDSESKDSEGVNGIQLTHVSVQRWVMANIYKPSGFVKGERFATG